MDMNFCRRCAAKLTHLNKHVYRCENDHVLFANASPSLSIWLLNSNDEVLVTKRGIEPGKGAYDSPGGFVNGGLETAEEAVARELKEELDLEPDDYEKLHYLTSTTGMYEYKGEKLPTLDLVYWGCIKKHAVITPKDDVASYKFLPIKQIDPDHIYITAIREGFLELRRQFL